MGFMNHLHKSLLTLLILATTSIIAGPHIFKTLDEAAQALAKKPAKLIYVAIGSANEAGKHNNYGYVQSLPLFAEHFFRNEDLVDQIQIILIDDTWQHIPYEKSDLARYLKEHKNGNLVKKIEDSIFIIADLLTEDNFGNLFEPSLLLAYLRRMLLKNNGALIFGTFYWHTRDFFEATFKDNFSIVTGSRRDILSEKRLHYFYWPHPNSLAYIDNREELVSAWWCDDQILNFVDQFTLSNNTSTLIELLNILKSQQLGDLTEKNKIFKDIVTDNRIQLEKYFEKTITNRLQEIKNVFIPNKIHMAGFSVNEAQKLSNFTAQELLKQPKPYALFSLVPTQNLPLIDFTVEFKDNKLIMNPTVTVKNNQFDFLDFKPYLKLPGIKKNYDAFYEDFLKRNSPEIENQYKTLMEKIREKK